MKRFLQGAVVALAVPAFAIIVAAGLGLPSTNADTKPPGWEARLMPLILKASLDRHAGTDANPVSPTEENLLAGVTTFKQMCARCHSLPGREQSIYGASFFPPAPNLAGKLNGYSDAQLFWTIKHGIRNTGMPAWSGMLSDEEIWQVVGLLSAKGPLPTGVSEEWTGPADANK